MVLVWFCTGIGDALGIVRGGSCVDGMVLVSSWYSVGMVRNWYAGSSFLVLVWKRYGVGKVTKWYRHRIGMVLV